MNKMKLKFIQFAANQYSNFNHIRNFNISGNSIGSLFLGNLINLFTDNYFKICIDCWNILPELNEITCPYPNEIKDINKISQRIIDKNYFYQNYIDKSIETLTIHRRFDFEKWFLYDKLLKKEMIVSEIYQSLLYLTNQFNTLNI